MSDLDNNMEEDIIVFEDEDGSEYSFTVLDYFFYNGEEYALLQEVTDEETDEETGGGCIVCQIVSDKDENGEETEEFVPVEDEDLAEKLFNIATVKLMNDEEEEE